MKALSVLLVAAGLVTVLSAVASLSGSPSVVDVVQALTVCAVGAVVVALGAAIFDGDLP